MVGKGIMNGLISNIKKVFYAVVLLLALSVFCSCEKSEGGKRFIQDNWIQLLYMPDMDPGFAFTMLSYYIEFGEDGKMTQYSLPKGQWARHYEGDPHLYVRDNAEWTPAATYNYSLDGDRLSFGDVSGVFKKIDKDTFTLDTGELLYTYHRIKSFVPKDDEWWDM